MNKRKRRLLFLAIQLVALFWFLRTYVTDAWQATLLLAGALAFGLCIGLVALCFRLKRMMVRAFGPESVSDGYPAQFPRLDLAELERLALEWESLGFEHRCDRAGNRNNARDGNNFTRIFEHPDEGALAEITQQFGPEQTYPFSASVFSLWGEREPTLQAAQRIEASATVAAPLAAPSGQPVAPIPVELDADKEIWLLSTHSRAPNKFWKLLARPRTLGRRLAPDATPAMLWSAHQEHRADVESRLKQPHLTGELVALLRSYGVVLRAQTRPILQRTPVWIFGAAHVSLAVPPANYDGELPA